MKFCRQYAIGAYILDFYRSEKKTAIEIDGQSHDERRDYDEQRTAYLASQGIRVLRYSNDDVIEDVDGVAEAIAVALGWKDDNHKARRSQSQ